MKKRITNIILILALFGYLIFIGRSDYMFSWLAHNNFCYVWAVIALLWFFRQDICAKWLTAGSVLAVFPAQIVENIESSILSNDVAKSSYWGIGTWIGLVVICLCIGAWFQFRNWRRNHPKPESNEQGSNNPKKTGK